MMRYRRSRIPGTGPPGSPGLVLQTLPDANLQVSEDGRVRGGADARALAADLRDANAVLRPLFRKRERPASSTRAPGAPWDPPDLSVFYSVVPAGPGFPDPVKLNERLRSCNAVTAAYIRPAASLTVLPSTSFLQPALDLPEPPGATRDLSPEQGYLEPARRGGIDARFAWTVPGGTGQGVTMVDVERAWNLTHEDLDLPADVVMGGWPMRDAEARSHGTSVVGMLAGAHNRSGVMGICPDANVRAVSVFGTSNWDSASAIAAAADRMSPGDIMQLELQRVGPGTPRHPRPSSQEGYIAVEWFPAELAAIRYAVSRGIIVVEAAGNGEQNLDADMYEDVTAFGPDWRNPFGSNGTDSGAIVVGAGAPPPGIHDKDHGADRSRLPFSNWGARVDVQGWGLEVTTTGGYAGGPDDLRPGPDENRWYTNRFSGTSSATPMVTGALVCIQGMLRAAGRDPLTPQEARVLVREEGLLQQSEGDRPDDQRIGRRPDLRAYHERVFHGAPLIDGAISQPRSQDMATKITITVEPGESGNGVQVVPNGGAANASDSERFTIAELLADPQWKGPSLSFIGPDGERMEFDIKSGRTSS
jgi:hypothetical protein